MTAIRYFGLKSLVNLVFLSLFFLQALQSKILFNKPYYYRSDMISVYCDDPNAVYTQVTVNTQPFKPFPDTVRFSFMAKSKRYKESVIPLGIKPVTGTYKVSIYDATGTQIDVGSTTVHAREPKASPSPYYIWTAEYAGDYRRIKVNFMNEEEVSYDGISRWMDFAGFNSFFLMVGQSDAERNAVGKNNPWIPENVATWQYFTQYHNRFILGGYVGSFLAFGPAVDRLPQYYFSYNIEQEKDFLYQSNFISITDRTRIEDVKKLLKTVDDDPNTRFIGLDYIRMGDGGFELYPEFERLFGYRCIGTTEYEKRKWLAVHIRKGDIPYMREKWRYFRAYKAGLVITEIARAMKKPVWTFTLGWRQGLEHGQDPVLFNDAGADLILVMLYEATSSNHNAMIGSWREYLQDVKGLNLVAGQDVDTVLCDAPDSNREGPEEILRRFKDACDAFAINGNLRGIFYHDITRCFYGRIRPFSSIDWMLAGASAITYTDLLAGNSPITVDGTSKGSNSVFTITNRSLITQSVAVSFYPNLWMDIAQTIQIKPKETISVPVPHRTTGRAVNRSMVTAIVAFNGVTRLCSVFY